MEELLLTRIGDTAVWVTIETYTHICPMFGESLRRRFGLKTIAGALTLKGVAGKSSEFDMNVSTLNRLRAGEPLPNQRTKGRWKGRQPVVEFEHYYSHHLGSVTTHHRLFFFLHQGVVRVESTTLDVDV